MVNDIEGLQEVWDTLDTCFDRPEKYIAEALDPIVKFRKYRAFDSGAIREFYSLLRSAMLGAKKASILHHLVNDQTLPSIMVRMPLEEIASSGLRRVSCGSATRWRTPSGPLGIRNGKIL
jgi:hypothetical protein